MMWAVAFIATAWASGVEIVTPEGAVRAGLPSVIHVVATGDDGAPLRTAPPVNVSAGTVSFGEEKVAPGVWPYRIVAPSDATELTLTVSVDGKVFNQQLSVSSLTYSRLDIPARIDGITGGKPVVFVIKGASLPPVEALSVMVGEGSVSAIQETDEGLQITVQPTESYFPRYIPVGVRDMRTDELPVWSGIRLRARPRIPLQTEPGVAVIIRVRGREYGPFVADSMGVMDATIDQYPGEMVAKAILTDKLGNRTESTLPLSTHARPALLAMVSGMVVPGRPLPLVYLRAIHGDGQSWVGNPPTCKSAAWGELLPIAIGKGSWAVPLPIGGLQGGVEPRLYCQLGRSAETQVALAVSPYVPRAMNLRVWPEELSTDFPLAEVQVMLEDARGERMSVDGVRVFAERGKVALTSREGVVGRWEYSGGDAVEASGDILHAKYHLPLGNGVPTFLELGFASMPAKGDIRLFGRILDNTGRPLAKRALHLRVEDVEIRSTTGDDGWAEATFQAPPGIEPVDIGLRSEHRAAHFVIPRGSGSYGGPGSALVVGTREIRFKAGRVAQIKLEVDPPVLYVMPGLQSVARIYVDLVDLADNRVTGEKSVLEASAGTVGPLFQNEDGRLVAEYTPPVGGTGRTIEITAHAANQHATTALQLELQPVMRAPGVALGMLTNFGEIIAPYLSVDLDWRMPWRWANGRLMVRFGVGVYADSTTTDLSLGEEAKIRMVIIPLNLGLLYRTDLPKGRAFWLGLGAVAAPFYSQASLGDADIGTSLGLLPPGFSGVVGIGIRVPGGGEVMTELRGLMLSSGGGDFALQGQVGGLGLVFGYRVSF